LKNGINEYKCHNNDIEVELFEANCRNKKSINNDLHKRSANEDQQLLENAILSLAQQ